MHRIYVIVTFLMVALSCLVLEQVLSADGAARIASDAAGAAPAAQQSALAAFEYGYHADEPGAAPGGKQQLTEAGLVASADDMES